MFEKIENSVYRLHPGFAMEARVLKNMKDKTGKNLQEWLEFVATNGPAAEKDQALWLKNEMALGTNYAKFIAQRAAGKGGAENYRPDELVATQYAGKKEGLLPVYDKLLELALAFGEDVSACPAKTFVSLYRKHVFGQIKATTQTRIDLGLALKNADPGELPETLIDTGGLEKGDRITHRFAVSSLVDITSEVTDWLRRAYDLDA